MSLRSDQIEDGESTSGSSEAKTDRYGFLLVNGDTNNDSDDPCPELVRHREMKWINLMSQWDQVLEKKHSKIKAQCQKGIPASVRSKCWPLLCGATQRKENNKDLYNTLESSPGQQSWIDVIKRDTDRQFPFHEMFQSEDSPGQQGLLQVLKAYTQFRPDEGYCQAQGPVAAVLLMHMPMEEAFWCLVQISELYLPGYYSPLLEGVLFDAAILFSVLKRTCPAAYKHMKKQGVEPLMFATDWLMCLYSRHLPFNTLLRVWDLFFCNGVRVLFQVAVVLVRRCLGEARHRKECEGQVETLERLRSVKCHVQHEQADAFIQEVCSVPLSLADLQRQTEKELGKWRKERPGSTFDPRDRCHGYYMIWEKGKERVKENEKKERQSGNLRAPVMRSHSSLSPAILRKKWRKRGSKTENEEWEGRGFTKQDSDDEEKRRASVCGVAGELRVKTQKTPPEFSKQFQKESNTSLNTPRTSATETLLGSELLDLDATVFEEDENDMVVIPIPLHIVRGDRKEETKPPTTLKEDDSEAGDIQQEIEKQQGTETWQDEEKKEQDPRDEEISSHQDQAEPQQEQSQPSQLEEVEDARNKPEQETQENTSKQEEETEIQTCEPVEEVQLNINTQEEDVQIQVNTDKQEEEEQENGAEKEHEEMDSSKQEEEIGTKSQEPEVVIHLGSTEEEAICNSNIQEGEIETKGNEQEGEIEEEKEIQAQSCEQEVEIQEEKEIQPQSCEQEVEIQEEKEIQAQSCEKEVEIQEEKEIQAQSCEKEVEIQEEKEIQAQSCEKEVEIQEEKEIQAQSCEKEVEIQDEKEIQAQSCEKEVEIQDEKEIQAQSCKQEVEIQEEKEIKAQSSDQEVEIENANSANEEEMLQICLIDIKDEQQQQEDREQKNEVGHILETEEEMHSNVLQTPEDQKDAEDQAPSVQEEEHECCESGSSTDVEKTRQEPEGEREEARTGDAPEEETEGTVMDGEKGEPETVTSSPCVQPEMVTEHSGESETPQDSNQTQDENIEVNKTSTPEQEEPDKTGGSSIPESPHPVKKEEEVEREITAESNPVKPAPSGANQHPQLRLRRSSSSHTSYPTILSEDTFRDPQQNVKRDSCSQNTEAEESDIAQPKQTQSSKQEDLQKPKAQTKSDKPKRKGLFQRLRADMPSKSTIPKIVIQDFSEGEEKLSSKERRRRRRMQERKEKEEEKERKKLEKELEKEKERERKKPQTRGKSFQVLSKKHDDYDDVFSEKSDSQEVGHKRTSYSESYF
ncbi:trichohyalin [Hemibagrus wyckioides]|uniref:trichohyalin n=1 Tax=Hemibagrus wyckioides TaxID=337641 RepID=UPI00266BE619|nr:trichohyalin [Hemibagrus wyckioides]XP_058253609.1 trichohyalin [Hemibagrus wyckioides]XP_058253610.1 trichohyalin [Hemibagrus wyckioides]